MNRYQAQAFISEVRDLLHCAANATEPLSSMQEKRLLDLEDEALKLLQDERDQLRISASTLAAIPAPAAVIEGEDAPVPNAYAGIRLQPVESIELQELSKLIEFEDTPYKVTFTRYTAHGPAYKHEGRTVHDSCTSSAEGFIQNETGLLPFGAASALAARLLEPLAAGLIDVT